VILGFTLLVWGVVIVLLAFKMQTKIQEGTDPEWRHARELYDMAPIIFCSCMFVALACWPFILCYLMYKFFAKGSTNGN